jgi:PAS domain S-box-containing protein
MARILVVDDEIIISTQLRVYLTNLGYEVVGTATSGEEAVGKAKNLRPDLILMDIVMRGELDGIVAAQMIQAEQDIPIIFLTAYADDKFISRAKDLEPFGYLVKPAQEREIKAAIEIALYKRDMERHLRESEARYRAIVEDQTEFICRFQPEGTLTFVNEAYCRFQDKQPEELIGRAFTSHISEEDREKVKQHVASLNLQNPVGTMEYRAVLQNGDTRWLQWTKRAIFGNGDRLIEFQAVGRDITERKQAEEEREKLIAQLQEALNKVKTLSGLLPICAACKKIRDDKGYWNELETYIRAHSEAKFTHGICPDCAKKLYPGLDLDSE